MTRDRRRSDSARSLIGLEFRLYRGLGEFVCALALVFLLVYWLGKDDTDPDAPAPADPAHQPRVDPDAIYARADLRWPAARLFKPVYELDGPVEFQLAPLVLERSDAADPGDEQRHAFGAVSRAASGTFDIDISKPTVYHGESTAILRGREYRQLRYQWWHAPPPSARSSQGVRMTLDDTGRAVIWETLTDDSGIRLIFVATPL